MVAVESKTQPDVVDVLQLMELFHTTDSIPGIEEFAQLVMPEVVAMLQLSAALLYVADPRLPAHHLTVHGLQSMDRSELQNLCALQLEQLVSRPDAQDSSVSVFLPGITASRLDLYPLYVQAQCIGLVGFSLEKRQKQAWKVVLERLPGLFSNAINDLLIRSESAKRLTHLNTYLTVSSMLSQSVDLHELLEMTLYCCMDVASAEAASVLVLDDDKENFNFYQVEGPAKEVLMAATFPADRGLAGSILQTQQSEVINDVRSDARFYRQVDSDSGFKTRNMIAVPLVAGKEKVGVLEVLNKLDGGSFTEEERLLLVSIAEEIAFAIRNAKMFEYVVNTYCKQRQGQMSCRGCERPLGSWTPCIKYREVSM